MLKEVESLSKLWQAIDVLILILMEHAQRDNMILTKKQFVA